MADNQISIDGTVLNPTPETSRNAGVNDQISAAPIVDPNVEGQEQRIGDKQVTEPLVNLSDFMEAKGNVSQPEIEKTLDAQQKEKDAKDKQKSEEKAAETSEEEASTENEKSETTTEVEQPKTEVSTQRKTATKVERDYTDIPESEHEVWKKMSNDSYAKLRPIYDENKRVKAEFEAQKTQFAAQQKELEDARKGIVRLPENYFEHPQGYLLTPEFTETAQAVQLAQNIQNHWEQQLQEVRGGAKEFTTLQQDPKTGQVFLGPKQPVDANTDTYLMKVFMSTQQQLGKIQGKLESMQEQHGNKVKEVNTWLQDFENNSFVALNAPEAKQQTEAMVKDIISKFHPALQRNPFAKSVASLILITNNLGALLKQAADERQKTGGAAPSGTKTATTQQQTKVADKKKAGPSAGEVSGDLNGNALSKQLVTAEDFQRAKSGY